MKLFDGIVAMSAAITLTILTGSISEAQITPDIDLSDPKEGIYIKTDPVLRGPLEPMTQLLAQLKSKGYRVESKIVEHDGFTTLDASVNGKPLAPVVIQCETCRIVFEY